MPTWRRAKKYTAPKRSAKIEVWERDGWMCHYCACVIHDPKGCEFDGVPNMATVEHIVPRSQGGGNDKANLVACCFACNNMRGDMSYEDMVGLSATGEARETRIRRMKARVLPLRPVITIEPSEPRGSLQVGLEAWYAKYANGGSPRVGCWG